MSETTPTNIRRMTIEYELGATVNIEEMTWVKPAVRSSVVFDGVPTPDEIEVTSRYLAREVVEPLLDEVIQSAVKKAVEAKTRS